MHYLQFIFLLLFPCLALADEPVLLSAMNIQPSASITHITFVLNKKTTGRVKYLPDAKQIIVEFTNAEKHFVMHHARLGGANVVSIDTKDLPNHGIQFIFSVSDKIRWTIRFLTNENNQGAKLELDIISIQHKQSKSKHGRSLEDDIFKILTEQATVNQFKSRLFTVVIDAGHGGRDLGAKGQSGTQEKKVVLAIAKRLARLINQSTNMRAVLTRDGDYFVPLRGRLKLARKDNADLFIAIHADAYFEKNARGASVYALSSGAASSEAARWLAQKDNYSELGSVELNALQDRSPLLRSVLLDLAQTSTIKTFQPRRHVLNALNDISALHINTLSKHRLWY